MRTQTFGVEIEMTGIARKTASEIAAGYFGTSSEHIGSSYDKYGEKDSAGRLWCFASDASIHVERGRGGEGKQVELITPILRYEDIEALPIIYLITGSTTLPFLQAVQKRQAVVVWIFYISRDLRYEISEAEVYSER